MVFTEDSKRGNRPSGLIQPVSTCARNLTGGTSIGDSVSIQRRYVEAAGLMVGMQCRICENKMLPQKNIKVWVVISVGHLFLAWSDNLYLDEAAGHLPVLQG